MRLTTAIVMLALFAAPAFAYDMADLRRDMHARVEKMMKEVGDVRLEQEGTLEGMESGPTEMKVTTYMRGALWRSEVQMSGGGQSGAVEITTLYDGTDTWSVTMGVKQKMPAGLIGQSGPTGFWNELPEDTRLLGEEKIGQRDAWKVEHAAPRGTPQSNGAPTTLWIDKSTFIPIRMETESFGKPVRMVMSDFREVKGYPVAHLTEMFTGKQKTMTMKILKLETGKGLSDDLFDAEKLEGGEGIDVNAMMKKALEMQKRAEQGKGNE